MNDSEDRPELIEVQEHDREVRRIILALLAEPRDKQLQAQGREVVEFARQYLDSAEPVLRSAELALAIESHKEHVSSLETIVSLLGGRFGAWLFEEAQGG